MSNFLHTDQNLRTPHQLKGKEWITVQARKCIEKPYTSHYSSNLFFYRSDDDDIAMQECVPYVLHKTKEINTTEGVYDECQVDPAIANTNAVYET